MLFGLKIFVHILVMVTYLVRVNRAMDSDWIAKRFKKKENTHRTVASIAARRDESSRR